MDAQESAVGDRAQVEPAHGAARARRCTPVRSQATGDPREHWVSRRDTLPPFAPLKLLFRDEDSEASDGRRRRAMRSSGQSLLHNWGGSVMEPKKGRERGPGKLRQKPVRFASECNWSIAGKQSPGKCGYARKILFAPSAADHAVPPLGTGDSASATARWQVPENYRPCRVRSASSSGGGRRCTRPARVSGADTFRRNRHSSPRIRSS